MSLTHPDLQSLRLRLAAQSTRDFLLSALPGGIMLVAAFVCLFMALYVDSNNQTQAFNDNGKGQPIWPWVSAGCGALALAIALFLFHALRQAERRSRLRLAELEARTEKAVRGTRGSTDLDTLLEVNRLLLAQYHQLSTGQSRSAFRLAQAVMVAAATLLMLGCFLAVIANSTVASVTIASLSGLASAVGGYVANTLLRSYQVSVRQAEMYFHEPVVAGYLLAGERVARSLSGEYQQQALMRVVDGFLQAATGLAQKPSDTSEEGATDE